jgi:hypothetical protein
MPATLTSCSARTTLFCATLLAVCRRRVLPVVNTPSTRRGSMTTVDRHVATAVVWNIGIGAPALLLIATWIDATCRRLQLCKEKEAYWLDRLDRDGRMSRMWRSISTILGRDRNIVGPTSLTAEDFAAFFTKKVDDVMAAT